MSRTDAHRPLVVRWRDPYEFHLWGRWHNTHEGRSDYDRDRKRWLHHFLIPCDLDLVRQSAPSVGTKCGYMPLGFGTCACWMCSQRDARRREHRRYRQFWRRALKHPHTGFDDADVIVPNYNAW